MTNIRRDHSHDMAEQAHPQDVDDGILIYKAGAGRRIRVLTAGTGITITDGGEPRGALTIATGELRAYKASDETVNSSTTLQDDDDLAFSIGASEVYAFELFLDVETGTSEDFKFAFTVPSGAAGTYMVERVSDTGSANQDRVTTITSTVSVSSAGTGIVVWIKGYVINSTTAGTVQLQWAQDSSGATDTTVTAGSYLIASKLS